MKPTMQPSMQPSSQPSDQPSGSPTSAPSYVANKWGEVVGDVQWKRHRSHGGHCENDCSHHGTCEKNINCKCYTNLGGDPEWTGADCSIRTCAHDTAWVGPWLGSDGLHSRMECSNKGKCDRKTGMCSCFAGYDGVACQRTACPSNCYGRGVCLTEMHLARKAGRVYDKAWDALKQMGCLCDAGYRGPSCEWQECPSGEDPLQGYGNEAGRDCSGRGVCDYTTGLCDCFIGWFGARCSKRYTFF
jgi:hypothetical protein